MNENDSDKGEKDEHSWRERGREGGRESKDTVIKEIKLLVVGEKGIREKERYENVVCH